MQTLLNSIPERPIKESSVRKLSNHNSVDWGASLNTKNGEVYVFLLVTDTKAYALGFDKHESKWGVIKSIERSGTGVVSQLDDEIEQWGKQVYGDNYEEYVPSLPDISDYR